MYHCPRCHRPVEGDEEYVCCAGGQLTWHCASCHKVYDGFAFPYGLCPACGGSLARGQPAASEDDVREAVRHALEIELGGEAFYRQGAVLASEPGLRELFDSLARMEAEHAALLRRRYHVDTEAPPEGDPSIPQIAVYAGAEELVVADGVALLELAVALEERARDFFVDQSEGCVKGTPSWVLYRELAAEEEEHVHLVRTELDLRRRGRTGLLG